MEQMNIASAAYRTVREGVQNIDAVIDGIEYVIPLDPANRHYAEIMRQVDEGTLTIQDADD